MLIVLSFETLQAVRALPWWDDVQQENAILFNILGYEKGDLLARAAGNRLWILKTGLVKDAPPKVQAAAVLERLEQTITRLRTGSQASPLAARGVLPLCAFIKDFPAGLYEALMVETSREPSPAGFTRLRPIRPSFAGTSVRRPFEEKNPARPISLEDTRFRLDLLDADEQAQLETALVNPGNVLVSGEPGTGKRLLARYIHYHTAETANGAFVDCDAASLSGPCLAGLLEGTAPASSPDGRGQEGFFSLANLGTLFFDQLALADPGVQKGLSRALPERFATVCYRRVGGTRQEETALRVVASAALSRGEWPGPLSGELLERFPLRIHLKGLRDKQPEPWTFYERAMGHFVQDVWPGSPCRTPSWDAKALEALHNNGRLPQDLRSLGCFVTRILDHRAERAGNPDEPVSEKEMVSALESLTLKRGRPGSAGATAPVHESGRPVTLESLKAFLREFPWENGIQGAERLSEDEAKQLVFQAKRLALCLALWNGAGNMAGARRVYGMPRADAFDKLRRDPSRLHPDAPKRERGTRGKN